MCTDKQAVRLYVVADLAEYGGKVCEPFFDRLEVVTRRRNGKLLKHNDHFTRIGKEPVSVLRDLADSIGRIGQDASLPQRRPNA